MRLADKFQCALLEKILKHHVTLNGPNCQSPTIALNWLKWSLQYNMPEEIVRICLNFQKIDDDSMEVMHAADRIRSDTVKESLNEYIKENIKIPSTALNWLILSEQYHMPQETIKACLPSVACLPSSTLRENEEKIGKELYAKMMGAKCQVLERKERRKSLLMY